MIDIPKRGNRLLVEQKGSVQGEMWLQYCVAYREA
jgi:hypothetical protein